MIRCRRMRHLIRVYTVCHTYSNSLDTLTGSKWTISNFRTSMVSRIGVPILRVNMVVQDTVHLFHTKLITAFNSTQLVIAPDKWGYPCSFFLILPQKHMLWVLIRSSHRDTSNEYPQHMISWRNKNKRPTGHDSLT